VTANNWKVLHAQADEIGPVTLEPGCGGIYLYVWHGDIPLGHLQLLASELPLSKAQLRNLVAVAIAPAVQWYLSAPHMDPGALLSECPLQRLKEMWPAAETPLNDEVSLIICTSGRPEQLGRCLRSVFAQTRRPAEVLVVDNSGGDPETRRVVASFEGVRCIVEKVPGLSRARNTGVRHASFPLIAFTDDDIVLSPNWLKHLAGVFADARVSAASGLVLPAELQTRAQLLFERDFGGFNQGYEPRRYGSEFIERAGRRAPPVWTISTGGNMAIRRRTFEQFGLFDERLGAGAAGCSEDSEYWYRILAGGGVCAYAPAAAVHHYHREDMESLRRQIYFYMRGHVAALFAQFGYSRRWNNLHRVFIELPAGYGQILLRWIIGSDPNGRVLLEGARGCVAGAWYWMRYGFAGGRASL
jgi:GT2 family glycosyltransferase